MVRGGEVQEAGVSATDKGRDQVLVELKEAQMTTHSHVYVSAEVAVCVCSNFEMKTRQQKQLIPTEHAPHTVEDIEPRELVKMLSFNAFEVTHASPHSLC